MRFRCIYLLLLFSVNALSTEMKSIEFFIDYFTQKDVEFVCALNCDGGNHIWSRAFTKIASKHLIAVSNVNINHWNYTQINKCLGHTLSSIGVVMDSSCEYSKEVLNLASEHLLFTSMHKWIVVEDSKIIIFGINDTEFSEKENNCKFCNEFENHNISVDSDITVAVQKDDYSYNLYDVYNCGEIQGGKLIVDKAGSWNHMAGLEYKFKGYKYYQRWDFKQWSMRIITVVSPQPKHFDPNILLHRSLTSSAGVADITKTSTFIMHVIAEIHNFRFNYTMADRWIGTFDRNDSKVVANALYYKEQDVSPAIRLLKSLQGKIDFLQPPVTSIETRYYYRIPTRGPGKFENQFLRPLSTNSWASVAAVLSLCSFLLLITARLEQRPSSVQYAVFSAFASMCQQFFQDIDDSVTRRASEARKLTILVTGISCVLIYNYYTSSVVSWLLIGPPPSITSLQELLDSPLELIFEDIGYTRSWMQTPTYYYNKRNAKIEDELRQKKVFNKKKGEPLFKSVEEGIALVKAGGYAYHTEVNSANTLISRTFTQSELCELGSLQSMEKTHLYPCVQKNSPYKEFLNWSLLRLSERGIVSCIKQRMRSNAITCEGSSPRALALGGAAPAFLLLASGYLLAVAVMLVERY